MKKSFLLLLAMMLATQVTFAQKAGHKGPRTNPELQKEMGAYIENNVQPVLLKAQQDFDAKLSTEDLSFIKEKREQATAQRNEMKANRQKAMELRQEGKTREEIQEVLGIDRTAKKEARQAERTEMKAFMERNKEAIQSTMETLKPSYEQWIKDQKTIVQKYRPEGSEGQERAKEGRKGQRGASIGLFGIAPPKHFRQGPKGHNKMEKRDGVEGKEGMEKKDRNKKYDGNKQSHRQQHGKTRIAVEFVLWDGTLPEPPQERPDMEGKSIQRGNDVFSLQNYPNPANGITKITANLPADTKVVKIVLRDASGKTVKNLLFKNVDKGTNTFDLDVSNMTDGLYFYTFEADGQTTTKRLMVGK
jgi:hypothetical protein